MQGIWHGWEYSNQGGTRGRGRGKEEKGQKDKRGKGNEENSSLVALKESYLIRQILDYAAEKGGKY
jgi:hypothetical protein